MNRSTRNILAIAVTTAILSACGGGGGGSAPVRPDSPPPPPPQVCEDPNAENTGGALPCIYPPPPPPPPQVCTDPDASNTGGELPCAYRYNGPSDNLLVGNNADLAHAEGFTGKGVKIGLLDGFRPTGGTSQQSIDGLEQYQPTAGKLQRYYDSLVYEGAAGQGTHGRGVAAIALGTPHSSFDGGIAPDALLYAMHGFSADEMIQNDDVRLINSSTSFGPSVLAQKSNALFVMSAGNHSGPEPGEGSTGGSPIDLPLFRDHFITAIALHQSVSGGRSDWNNDPWGGESASAENVSENSRYEIYKASYSSPAEIQPSGASEPFPIPGFQILMIKASWTGLLEHLPLPLL